MHTKETNLFAVPEDFGLQLLNKMTEPAVKHAYICSPCSAPSTQEVYRNMKAAQFYMYYASQQFGYLPRALHAYVIYNDLDSAERMMALCNGCELLAHCNVLLVCGNRITQGMRQEIRMAAELQIPVLVFHPDLVLEVRKIVTRAGAKKTLVTISDKAPLLAKAPEELLIA